MGSICPNSHGSVILRPRTVRDMLRLKYSATVPIIATEELRSSIYRALSPLDSIVMQVELSS